MSRKGTENTGFSHGPQAKREDQLTRWFRYSLLGHGLWLIGSIIVVTAVILKPDNMLVVEKESGRIVGEYRTTAYRTSDELIAGAVKFAGYHLSLNSQTVYDDYQSALNMMTPELAEKRSQYFERSNLLRKVEMAKTRSHLKFEEMKIVHTDKSFAKVALAGQIVSDHLRDNSSLPRNQQPDEEEVKLLRNNIPFRLVVDLQMVPVTVFNTVGVQVVGYYDAE